MRPLSVVKLAGTPAAAIVVTTPQEVSIADVRRCIRFCQAVSLRVLGVLENMSGLVCPRCGAQIDLFKTGGGEALALETGIPFLGRIPIDPAIVLSGDEGTPLVSNRADRPAASAFLALAGRIADASAQPSNGSSGTPARTTTSFLPLTARYDTAVTTFERVGAIERGDPSVAAG